MKKSLVIGLLIILCLSLSLVSASWFSDFIGKITGNAVKNQVSCVDSDFGNNPNAPGIVVYEKNGKNKTYRDYCYSNDKKVKEYYCEKNKVKIQNYKCETGCDNGACVGNTEAQTSCCAETKIGQKCQDIASNSCQQNCIAACLPINCGAVSQCNIPSDEQTTFLNTKKCNDSDNGIDFGEYGLVYNGDYIFDYDQCLSNELMIEAYCNNSEINYVLVVANNDSLKSFEQTHNPGVFKAPYNSYIKSMLQLYASIVNFKQIQKEGSCTTKVFNPTNSPFPVKSQGNYQGSQWIVGKWVDFVVENARNLEIVSIAPLGKVLNRETTIQVETYGGSGQVICKFGINSKENMAEILENSQKMHNQPLTKLSPGNHVLYVECQDSSKANTARAEGKFSVV
ncbi:MAG: hypothetical protein NT076_01210 [Candidatus Pacearchaeota archaeon]|nr:hypothetical protein [Candidatus Pacearchaeota archaeon]